MHGNTALNFREPDTRAKVRLAVFCGFKDKRLMTDYTVNMSTGGIFIETRHITPKDTPLSVVFMLPGNEAPIACSARVAWTNGPGKLKSRAHPRGMGLQFLDLSLEDIHALRDFIKRHGLEPVCP